MLSRPESPRQLNARLASEFGACSARIVASRSRLRTHIAISRALLAESRELLAQADLILGSRKPA